MTFINVIRWSKERESFAIGLQNFGGEEGDNNFTPNSPCKILLQGELGVSFIGETSRCFKAYIEVRKLSKDAQNSEHLRMML